MSENNRSVPRSQPNGEDERDEQPHYEVLTDCAAALSKGGTNAMRALYARQRRPHTSIDTAVEAAIAEALASAPPHPSAARPHG